MGRWLNKLDKPPVSELTKPTKPSSVSFVSTNMDPFQKNNHAELKSLIEKVSIEYGGDDPKWLAEYIEEVKVNNELYKAIYCFESLHKVLL